MVDQRFVENLADTIKSQRESYELEIREKLHDAEIVKAKGPDKWIYLNSWMVENIEAANQRGAGLEYVQRPPNDFRVARSFNGSVSSVDVQFSKNGMGITVNGGRTGIPLCFSPKVQGAEIVYTEGSFPKPRTTLDVYTIEEIGKKILTRV